MTREELNNQVVSGARQSSKLQYSDFKKIILDFQLQEHERFLIKFTNLFKSVDNDQDGVISEVQFKDLLRMMNILQTEEDIEQLLAQVDPFNNKKMTYSEVVLVLSSHMVPKDPYNPMPSQQVAILEKFIQENEHQQDMMDDGEDGEQLRSGNQGVGGNELSELGYGQSNTDLNNMPSQNDFTDNQPSDIQQQQPYADENREDSVAV